MALFFMSVEPFITVTLEERPEYDIFYIVVNHSLPTLLQWVFTMEEVKEGLEKCKVKGKRFAFIMDVRQLGMLSIKHTKEFVALMESYGDMFVGLLIGSSVFSHKNSILDMLFTIVKQFYNTKKPLKFLYTKEDTYTFIEDQHKLWK
jgi:hypothetical protein